MEFRNIDIADNIRANEESGIIEGYFSVFDTVDSYNSIFERGAFVDSIEKKKNKVKLLWNHENGFGRPLTIIGKVLDIREDNHGAWFKGQLFKDDPDAIKVWRLIKEGVISTLSFGFSILNDEYRKGVQHIQKVDLFEISPVAFEANQNAVITGARNHFNKEYKDKPIDVKSLRAKFSFLDNLKSKNLHELKHLFIESLSATLMNIWYSELDSDSKINLISETLDSFKEEYLGFSQEYLANTMSEMSIDNLNELPIRTQVVLALEQTLKNRNCNLQQLAMDSELSFLELIQLTKGEQLRSNPIRLKKIDKVLYDLHQKLVEQNIKELTSLAKALPSNRQAELRKLFINSEQDDINELQKGFESIKSLLQQP